MSGHDRVDEHVNEHEHELDDVDERNDHDSKFDVDDVSEFDEYADDYVGTAAEWDIIDTLVERAERDDATADDELSEHANDGWLLAAQYVVYDFIRKHAGEHYH